VKQKETILVDKLVSLILKT